MPNPTRAAVFFALSLIFVASGGCGKKKGPVEMADISGTVVVKDKALAKEGLAIMFDSGESTGSVPVKADGTFSGQAPVGKCKVYLIVSGGVSDHSDTKSVASTFGVDAGFINGEARTHEVDIPSGGKTGMKLDFGPGAGNASSRFGGPSGGH